MSKKETIRNQLNKLAFQESIPFFCSCYIKAPTGLCDNCSSNNLMRFIEDFGCEWGTEWVIEELIKLGMNSGSLCEWGTE